MMKEFIDEDGHKIKAGDGWLFIDGVCYEEPGTDADFDRYSVQVQNHEGYYNEDGHYRSYGYNPER